MLRESSDILWDTREIRFFERLIITKKPNHLSVRLSRRLLWLQNNRILRFSKYRKLLRGRYSTCIYFSFVIFYASDTEILEDDLRCQETYFYQHLYLCVTFCHSLTLLPHVSLWFLVRYCWLLVFLLFKVRIQKMIISYKINIMIKQIHMKI